jgi:hypothetical protein
MLLVEGVTKSHCIDAQLVGKLAPGCADGLKSKPTRADCGCIASVDIGVYDTCLFECAYCYATSRAVTARQRHAAHDAQDSLLWRPEYLRGQDLDEIAISLKSQAESNRKGKSLQLS